MPCPPTGQRQTAILGLLLLSCIIVMLAAYGFEHIGGYKPCKLCLQQREGYYIGMPVLIIALLAQTQQIPACIPRGLLVFFAVMMLYSFSVAVYQSGAEWGFWPGPAECSSTAIPTKSVSPTDLLASLNKTTIIRCDVAQLRVLGLSFAGWNALLTGGLALLALWAAFTSASLPARFRHDEQA